MESKISGPLRVALFTDSYDETNGVATVSQQYEAFARRRELPFAIVHSGAKVRVSREGTVTRLELKRSLVSFAVDQDLYCDVLLSRYRNRVIRHLTEFQPDLIHITGPGDMGVLGFWVAHCMRVPLAASWHTNLHEYAGRRLEKMCAWMPRALRCGIARQGEELSLQALVRFYRLPHFILVPNLVMANLLRERTTRPVYLMDHGVDCKRFAPEERRRDGGPLRIGYVGRLTPEKNVRAFAALERELESAGEGDFQFLLVGEGSERDWLRRHMRRATMPGVLRGGDLAAAYASMDIFVFPSRTDTFGLVVLEALASGVPVVATPQTGARVGVPDGAEGIFTDDFADGVLRLARSPAQRCQMSAQARRFASTRGWEGVFTGVYRTYEEALQAEEVRRRLPQPREQ